MGPPLHLGFLFASGCCFLYAFPPLLENFFIAVLVLLSHLLYSQHLENVSTGGEMTFLRENRGGD